MRDVTVYDGDETAIQTTSIVRPLVSVEEARQASQLYEALKRAIQEQDDIFVYQGREFLKKKFWRKLAYHFGLSLETVSETQELDEHGALAYKVVERATAPNGRYATGDGYCTRSEKGHEQWPEHTVRGTAHTRARNRAISDLVGGGEVSAEEVEGQMMPQRSSGEDDIDVGAFVREGAKLGLSSLQMAQKLGTTPGKFGSLPSRRQALRKLQAMMVTPIPEATIVEADAPPEPEAAPSPAVTDENWDFLHDDEFKALARELQYRTVGDLKRVVMQIDQPHPRKQVVMNALRAQRDTPPLENVETGSDA